LKDSQFLIKKSSNITGSKFFKNFIFFWLKNNPRKKTNVEEKIEKFLEHREIIS